MPSPKSVASPALLVQDTPPVSEIIDARQWCGTTPLAAGLVSGCAAVSQATAAPCALELQKAAPPGQRGTIPPSTRKLAISRPGGSKSSATSPSAP